VSAPLTYRWDGEAMQVAKRHQRAADAAFTIGAEYDLVEHQDRSEASHGHEFAWLKEAWRNLPERYADNFPTTEHLRKRALIDAGFFNEEIIDAGSNAAALRVASAFRRREEFSLVIVRGAFVFIRSAKSQSRRAMDKAEFQASKQGIIDVVSAMLEVAPADLVRQREAA
jgi:hypothetical protein